MTQEPVMEAAPGGGGIGFSQISHACPEFPHTPTPSPCRSVPVWDAREITSRPRGHTGTVLRRSSAHAWAGRQGPKAPCGYMVGAWVGDLDAVWEHGLCPSSKFGRHLDAVWPGNGGGEEGQDLIWEASRRDIADCSLSVECLASAREAGRMTEQLTRPSSQELADTRGSFAAYLVG